MRCGRTGNALTRAVVLVAAGALVWGAGGWLALRARDSRLAAEQAAHAAETVGSLADELQAARSRGPRIQVRRMSRAEADSWAYWETVAGNSGISTDQISIDPEFEEDESRGPTLLTTTVEIRPVPLEQAFSFLRHITEERPYVGISSVMGVRRRDDRWEMTVQAFLYFQESS